MERRKFFLAQAVEFKKRYDFRNRPVSVPTAVNVVPTTGFAMLSTALRSKQAEQVTRQVIDRGVTQHATPEMKEWIVQCNLKMPRDLAGTLAYNHWHIDWRDLIPRINLPTLIISGRASGAAPWKSQEWIHRQITGSQFEVFEEAEGGQHFMFIENPEKFNRMIMKYLG